MNDTGLRQLLQDADHGAPAAAAPAPAAFAGRVRAHQRRQVALRRRLAVSTAAALVTICVASPFFVNRSQQVASSEPAQSAPTLAGSRTAPAAPFDLPITSVDEQLADCERRIAALERGERLARVRASRAAVRDPLADAEERRADAMLSGVPAAKSASVAADAARRRVLDLVLRMYPQTVAATVARLELDKNEPEKRI